MRIFQAFNWQLNDIYDNVETIAKQGFTHIMTSPLAECKAGNEWYWLYQPLNNFKIGNRIGTKEDLKILCDKAKDNNIEIMVDVVFAHVGNYSGQEPNRPSDDVDSEILSHPEIFRERRNIENWNDRWQLTHWNIGLAGVDGTNEWWINKCEKYLKELISVGVTSLRYDASRHLDPYFFKRMKEDIHDKYNITAIGEVLNCGEDEINLYSQYLYVLTNSTGGDRNRVVKFNCSHDSELNNDGNGFSRFLTEEQIMNDYKEMTKYYPNTMLFPRAFSRRWEWEDIREANYRFR